MSNGSSDIQRILNKPKDTFLFPLCSPTVQGGKRATFLFKTEKPDHLLLSGLSVNLFLPKVISFHLADWLTVILATHIHLRT